MGVPETLGGKPPNISWWSIKLCHVSIVIWGGVSPISRQTPVRNHGLVGKIHINLEPFRECFILHMGLIHQYQYIYIYTCLYIYIYHTWIWNHYEYIRIKNHLYPMLAPHCSHKNHPVPHPISALARSVSCRWTVPFRLSSLLSLRATPGGRTCRALRGDLPSGKHTKNDGKWSKTMENGPFIDGLPMFTY